MLSNTLQTVKYYNLNIKKKFGQNFLIDQNIIKKIIDAVDVTENDTIIEIGPGIGTLTQFLLDANKIFAIELDKDLVKVLQEKFVAQKNLQIINADILKFDLQKLIDSKNVKIVSNLPYYISTAVITKCLTLQIQSMIVMVQKEVGERIFAHPSTKSYGSLSIFSQFYAEISEITKVSSNSFLPRPKVESMVIKFTMKGLHEKKFLFELVQRAFSKRRKTLINCLDNFYGLSKQKITDILIQNNLDKNIRGEALTIENFIKLAKQIEKLIH